MASKSVSIKEWTCDGCDAKAHADTLPSGWTDKTTTTIDIGGAPHSKGLDLCPACSTDPARAVRNYKASLRQ